MKPQVAISLQKDPLKLGTDQAHIFWAQFIFETFERMTNRSKRARHWQVSKIEALQQEGALFSQIFLDVTLALG